MFLRDLDFEKIVNRHELTFERQNHDRPVLYLCFPEREPQNLPPPPKSLYEKWFGFERNIDAFERHTEVTGFLCEGFPAYGMCNLGPDVLAAFMGSQLEFAETTSWARYRVDDWAAEPPLRFHREGPLWQAMERYLKLCAERGKGKWLVGSGDLHSNADGLAALRGPERLLLDLIDQPDEIHKRLKECHEVFLQVAQAHFDILHSAADGFNTSWIPLAGRGRYAVIQNDFCCMVGPEMFDTFFKDYVEWEAASVERAVYHLDGPGAIPHVPSICASPHLEAIQWVPGAGRPPICDWPELLIDIQRRGKGLWLNPGNLAEAEKLMRALKPEGCFYCMWCKSRAEAEAVVRLTETVYHCRIE